MSRRKSSKGKSKERIISKQRLAEILSKQRQQAKDERAKQKAIQARIKFKPLKKDFGKIVMIGVKGERNPQAKGRKGYLVSVSKTGKKKLTKVADGKNPYKPVKIADVEPQINKKNIKQVKNFLTARRDNLTADKRVILRCKDSFKMGGSHEFSESVVTKMATSLKECIERQASHRSFLMNANVLVRLPDGSNRAYNVLLPIDKPDHISIELGGMKNFIRKKFYAFMARELAFDGLVTTGSANHIRRLADNEDADPSEWVEPSGEIWRGNESEICNVRSIEWRIEQSL